MELTPELKELYPFNSNFLNLRGHKYHYIDEGNKSEDTPVIVMVHGNPTWSFYYRNLITQFSKTHRVIVPDHFGCGLSDKPTDYEYTLENRVKDLTDLLNHLGVKKYNMVVHDWGGAIGFGHAVKHAQRIEKMVILNTAAFISPHIPFTINLCKNSLFGPFIVKYFNAFCYPATFMTTVKKLSTKVKQGYLSPYQGPKNRIAISEFVQDIPMNEKHRSYKTLKDIEDNLHLLEGKEKLILWGGKDFCFNDHFFKKWREIFPAAKYEYFEDAGHYVIEDKKEETGQMMEAFFGA